MGTQISALQVFASEVVMSRFQTYSPTSVSTLPSSYVIGSLYQLTEPYPDTPDATDSPFSNTLLSVTEIFLPVIKSHMINSECTRQLLSDYLGDPTKKTGRLLMSLCVWPTPELSTSWRSWTWLRWRCQICNPDLPCLFRICPLGMMEPAHCNSSPLSRSEETLAHSNGGHPDDPLESCLQYRDLEIISPNRSGWHPHLPYLSHNCMTYSNVGIRSDGHRSNWSCLYKATRSNPNTQIAFQITTNSSDRSLR